MGEVENTPAVTEKLSYSEMLKFASPIAQPMASKSLTKKILKLVKKAAAEKNTFLGLKETQKRIRRGTKGLVIFGADVTPIDVVVHMPGVCEDKDIPYCYVPSREDLGNAAGLQKSAVMVLITPNEKYKETYDDVREAIVALPVPL